MINSDPVDVIEYISSSFPFTKSLSPDKYSREVCSALAYQFLLRKHGIFKTIKEILDEEPYIGLLGQRDEFEMFSSINFLKLHAILHDAYGRVYNKYGYDRGYCYAFKTSFKRLKSSPFCGHITGFWFCLHHKLFN